MKTRILGRAGPVVSENKYGTFSMYCYIVAEGSRMEEHLALVYGTLSGTVPIRINSACLTSEVFHDNRCDCAWQLDEALRRFVEYGQGVLLYHVGQEGRGIGLFRKIESYRLMDDGLSTSEAFESLGEPQDARIYGASVAILQDLDVKCVKLLSNNPSKVSALVRAGIEVESVDEIVGSHNLQWHRYLQSKVDSFGHTINLGAESHKRPAREEIDNAG
jgi:GTP cyclohydrolase II